jgi:hypothetical protein
MLKKLSGLALLFIAMLSICLMPAAPALAADVREGESLTIASGEVVNDDLYLFGSDITVDGSINGDLVAFGDKIVVNGTVTGTINCAGNSVTIKGKQGGSVRAAGSSIDIEAEIPGNLTAAGGNITAEQASSIGRDIYAAAGTMTLDGPTGRDIKGSAGSLVINNRVGGSVIVNCGTLKLGPGAHIEKDLIYRSENNVEKSAGAAVRGETTHVNPEQQPRLPRDLITQAISGIASAMISFIILLILVITALKYAAALLTGIVIILLARKYIPGLLETLKDKPWHCLGYGALLFFLAPAAIAVAFMLIIGIPLGLMGLALYIAAVYLGHLFTGLFIGKWLLRQPADVNSKGKLIGALALGLLIVYILSLLPGIGCLTDLAAVLFGMGALACRLKSSFS